MRFMNLIKDQRDLKKQYKYLKNLYAPGNMDEDDLMLEEEEILECLKKQIKQDERWFTRLCT